MGLAIPGFHIWKSAGKAGGHRSPPTGKQATASATGDVTCDPIPLVYHLFDQG